MSHILYLSHGGGPLPLLGDPNHAELVTRLRTLGALLPRPSAILVISAHWEAAVPTLTAGVSPNLIYDYYGFPARSYEIRYPAPGEPRLAAQIQQVLTQAGLEARLDAQRGFDHGLFVPLKLLYPGADIPCVQLSLVDSLDAATHLAIGRALRALEQDNLLVIGSGSSFHNMAAFRAPDQAQVQRYNKQFEAWLAQTCCDPRLGQEERMARLLHWEQAPGARFCHPREEHLLPLHLCAAMAGKPAEAPLSARIMGVDMGIFHWPGSVATR